MVEGRENAGVERLATALAYWVVPLDLFEYINEEMYDAYRNGRYAEQMVWGLAFSTLLAFTILPIGSALKITRGVLAARRTLSTPRFLVELFGRPFLELVAAQPEDVVALFKFLKRRVKKLAALARNMPQYFREMRDFLKWVRDSGSEPLLGFLKQGRGEVKKLAAHLGEKFLALAREGKLFARGGIVDFKGTWLINKPFREYGDLFLSNYIGMFAQAAKTVNKKYAGKVKIIYEVMGDEIVFKVVGADLGDIEKATQEFLDLFEMHLARSYDWLEPAFRSAGIPESAEMARVAREHLPEPAVVDDALEIRVDGDDLVAYRGDAPVSIYALASEEEAQTLLRRLASIPGGDRLRNTIVSFNKMVAAKAKRIREALSKAKRPSLSGLETIEAKQALGMLGVGGKTIVDFRFALPPKLKQAYEALTRLANKGVHAVDEAGASVLNLAGHDGVDNLMEVVVDSMFQAARELGIRLDVYRLSKKPPTVLAINLNPASANYSRLMERTQQIVEERLGVQLLPTAAKGRKAFAKITAQRLSRRLPTLSTEVVRNVFENEPFYEALIAYGKLIDMQGGNILEVLSPALSGGVKDRKVQVFFNALEEFSKGGLSTPNRNLEDFLFVLSKHAKNENLTLDAVLTYINDLLADNPARLASLMAVPALGAMLLPYVLETHPEVLRELQQQREGLPEFARPATDVTR